MCCVDLQISTQALHLFGTSQLNTNRCASQDLLQFLNTGTKGAALPLHHDDRRLLLDCDGSGLYVFPLYVDDDLNCESIPCYMCSMSIVWHSTAELCMWGLTTGQSRYTRTMTTQPRRIGLLYAPRAVGSSANCSPTFCEHVLHEAVLCSHHSPQKYGFQTAKQRAY